MATPYTSVSVSNYNLNPPADDGSEVPSNQLNWSKHKTKLADPLKTALESINTNLVTAFGKVAGGVTAVTDDYQMLSSDQSKLVVQSGASKTTTTPDATSVTSPFGVGFLNAHATTDQTLDGSGSQTIDGAASITIPAGMGVWLETDGANWFTTGQAGRASSATQKGIVELATDAEAQALADTARAVTPSNLAALVATQANQETGTATDRFVSPGRQHFHPGHPKFWLKASVSAGTPAIDVSYNVTSITDDGAGILTVTIATDFSSEHWCCMVAAELVDITLDIAGDVRNVSYNTMAAGTVVLQCHDNNTNPPVNLDPASWSAAGLGDQA